MTRTVPTDTEIRQAVADLFVATATLDRIARWNAVVPSDPGISARQGQKHVTYVPSYEARELVDFVLDIDEIIEAVGAESPRVMRILLVGYCHIMESELSPTLIWNQLRLLKGLDPSWRFTRTTQKGKVLLCKYPGEKFAEISTLAGNVGQSIGDIVQGLWDRRLRNAFSHSRYWLASSRVILSGDLSPISREGNPGSAAGSYSLPELREYYRGSRTFLLEVASAHGAVLKALNQ
ncbi:MAG: hypothetical protein AB1625_15630 [Acidobacteriota bacterium]